MREPYDSFFNDIYLRGRCSDINEQIRRKAVCNRRSDSAKNFDLIKIGRDAARRRKRLVRTQYCIMDRHEKHLRPFCLNGIGSIYTIKFSLRLVLWYQKPIKRHFGDGHRNIFRSLYRHNLFQLRFGDFWEIEDGYEACRKRDRETTLFGCHVCLPYEILHCLSYFLGLELHCFPYRHFCIRTERYFTVRFQHRRTSCELELNKLYRRRADIDPDHTASLALSQLTETRDDTLQVQRKSHCAKSTTSQQADEVYRHAGV